MTPQGVISEDDRYRTSSQFRLWSFTPSSLLSLRTTTNQLAAEHVREAVRRAREARRAASADVSEADTENSRAASAAPEGGAEMVLDCLTVEEELKLVAFYCRQTIQLGDHLKLPTEVKATAIQYMKRFYITNSLMTYDPASILKTALFFATKTENHYFRLTKFAEAIGKTKPEDVLASEFLLTQGLRFTFDVRHPFRALEGAVMEMQAMANNAIPVSDTFEGTKPSNMTRRVKEAHGKAREYLKISALLTDVYFYYTPSQIMMGSLFIADEELIKWYLAVKLQESSDIHEKVLKVVSDCTLLLQTVPPTAEPPPDERREIAALGKKLKKCRNPEKIDLVGLQRAKREGELAADHKIIKKRKLERETLANEGEDLFGPGIKKK